MSSLFDRACELYYSLVGGTVDYGDDHSSAHQHSRYGRTFSQGLYPVWSKERPLHFIGHSVASSTSYLSVLSWKFISFCVPYREDPQSLNYSTSWNMAILGPIVILIWSSPSTLVGLTRSSMKIEPSQNIVQQVCAPFRGTQLVYSLGESLTSAPEVRPFSLGAWLGKLVHVIAYFSPILPSIVDVHADSRSLSFRETSVLSFLRQLWQSQWAESKDAAPYDMTFEAAENRERLLEGRVYSNTFYRSYVAVMVCSWGLFLSVNMTPSQLNRWNRMSRPVNRSQSATKNIVHIWYSPQAISSSIYPQRWSGHLITGFLNPPRRFYRMITNWTPLTKKQTIPQQEKGWARNTWRMMVSFPYFLSGTLPLAGDLFSLPLLGFVYSNSRSA